MEARKLLYTMLAVSPAVLMAGIGIHARTYVDPFEWPSAIEDHLRTTAYIPLVIETQDLLARPNENSRSNAPRLAAKWINGAKAGDLKPLMASTLDESPSGGNKAKVLGANYQLARALVQASDSEIEVGNFEEAAKNLSLASDALNCLKYSSFLSLYRVTLAQHNILARVQSVYQKASPETKRELVMTMQRMKTDEKQASRLTRHTMRLIKAEIWAYRETHPLVDSDEEPNSAGAFFEQPALAKSNGLPPEEELENIEFAAPNLSLEVNQCVAADQRNRLMIQKIMSLSPPSVS